MRIEARAMSGQLCSSLIDVPQSIVFDAAMNDCCRDLKHPPNLVFDRIASAVADIVEVDPAILGWLDEIEERRSQFGRRDKNQTGQ